MSLQGVPHTNKIIESKCIAQNGLEECLGGVERTDIVNPTARQGVSHTIKIKVHSPEWSMSNSQIIKEKSK